MYNLMSIVLRARWLWQQEKDPSKPWLGLPIPSDDMVQALFHVSTCYTIHNGHNISFWSSHWLQGWPLRERFPNLYRGSKQRNICLRDAITNRAWISRIKQNPSLLVLTEYVQLWVLLQNYGQLPFDELEDVITWRWTASGEYSVASAYTALLAGRVPSTVMPKVWKTKAIPKCRLDAWLLLQNKCLTTDNLAKRGWPHNPICCLCLTSPKTASHISATCPYSVRVWEGIAHRLQFPARLAPSANTSNLCSWWVAPTNQIGRAHV